MKKITNLFAITILLSGLMGLIGCKKDSKTDLLTDHSWKITASTVTPGIEDPFTGNLVTNLYDWAFISPDCVKDDFYTFKTDGNMILDEGATKCDATDPQTTTSTWAFNNSETIITVTDSDGDATDVTLTELTEDKMVITYTEAIDNVVYTFTQTYSPK